MDFDAVKQEMEDATSSNGGRSTDAGLDSDEQFREAPIVNVRPEAAIEFEEIVVFDFNGRIDAEQNIFKPNSQEYGDQFIIGLRNARVVHGELWSATNGNPADYKVVGSEDPNVEAAYGPDGQVGININGNKFESEQIEDGQFPEDVVKVFRGAGAGLFLGKFLDTHGQGGAYIDDTGEKVNALIEYPDDDDLRERVARSSTLRADMVGNGGRLVFTFGEDPTEVRNAPHQTAVQRETDDGEYELLDLVGPNDDVYEPPEYNACVQWAESTDGGPDTSSDSTEGAIESFEATVDETPDVSEYTDLDGIQQEFVDHLVENVGVENPETFFDDWESTVQAAIEDDGMTAIDDPPTTADVLAGIVIAKAA